MPVLVNTSTGLAENLTQQAADQALSAGTHEIPLTDPQGNPGTASLSDTPQLIQEGYSQPGPKGLKSLLDEAKFSSAPETVKAGVEAVGRGFAGPAFTALERAVGVPAENILGRQEAHPALAPTLEGASFLGSALLGTGEAAILGKIGEGAKALTGIGEGAGLIGGAARGAIGLGSEFAAFSAGDEGSKFLMNDPNQTAGSALANIGFGGILGAATGGAFGSVSPLWKMTVGPKVAQALEDFSSRLKYRSQNPDLVGTIAGQLGDFYDSVSSMNRKIWGTNGIKMKLAQEMLPEMNEGILKQVDSIKSELRSNIDYMEKNPHDFTSDHVNKLRNQLNSLEEATSVKVDPITLEKKVPSSLEVFDAMNSTKQSLDDYAKWDATKPKEFMGQMRKSANAIRGALEDTSVWGDAADLQKSINKGFSAWKDISEGKGSFASRFMTTVNGEPVLDRSKIATFLRSNENTGAARKEVLDLTLKAGEQYKQAVHDAFSKLGLESPVQMTPTDQLQALTGKAGLGHKMADYIYDKGLSKILGESLGTASGAGIGALLGHPGVGAIIGERALSPFFSSVLPSIVKPIMEKAANVEAFKSTASLGVAALKGLETLSSATKALFNVGSHSFREVYAQSATDRQKLKDALAKAEKDPSSLLNIGGQTGYYAPDHATALASSVAQGVQYLNSIKPREHQSSPLDKPMPISQAEERAYDRALDIAENPVLTLKSLKEGTLTSQDMKTLKATNPGWYALASKQLFSEMTKAASSGKEITMQEKMGLSLFLGQPLDSNLMPNVIISNQQALNAPSLSTQALPKEGRKTAPLGPMKNIKLAGRVATRTQKEEEV